MGGLTATATPPPDDEPDSGLDIAAAAEKSCCQVSCTATPSSGPGSPLTSSSGAASRSDRAEPTRFPALPLPVATFIPDGLWFSS